MPLVHKNMNQQHTYYPHTLGLCLFLYEEISILQPSLLIISTVANEKKKSYLQILKTYASKTVNSRECNHSNSTLKQQLLGYNAISVGTKNQLLSLAQH